MYYTSSMEGIFHRFEKTGWIYAYLPEPSSSKGLGGTIRNMFNHGLLQEIQIPHGHVRQAFQQNLPAIVLTVEGARVHFTCGYRLPFEHETGWKGYSDWVREIEDGIEWQFISFPNPTSREKVKTWCLENDVAAKFAHWGGGNTGPTQATTTLIVEKRNVTKFLLYWG